MPPLQSCALRHDCSRAPALLLIFHGQTHTCAIAAEYGARIYHHPWTGDFSLHRNQSLDYATGDWVLIIDGDEKLDPGNLRRLLDQVHGDPQVDALSVRVDAVTENGLAEQLEAIRVFRRTCGRYRYPVHNQLEGITACVPSSAVVTAYYVGTLEQKAARSLPLLMALAEREETRSHAAFFLAKTWRALQRFTELRPWTAECKRLVPTEPGYATFWLWEIEAALVLEGMDAAEAVLAEAQGHHPDFVELHRYRAAFALFRWQEKAPKPSAYRASSVTGDRFAGNIPAAAQALGLPLEFRERTPPSAAAPHAREVPEKSERVATNSFDAGGGGVGYSTRGLRLREGKRVLRGHQGAVSRKGIRDGLRGVPTH